MFQLGGSVFVPLGLPVTVAVVLPAGHSITDVENLPVPIHVSGDPSHTASVGREPAVAPEIHADTDDTSAIKSKPQLDKKPAAVSETPVKIEEVSENISACNSAELPPKVSEVRIKLENQDSTNLVDRGVLKVEDQSIPSTKILKSPEGVERRHSRTVVMEEEKRRGGDEGFESADAVKETSLGLPSESPMHTPDTSDRIVLKAEDERYSGIPAGLPLSAPKPKGRPPLESYTNGPVHCETCRKPFRCSAALRAHMKTVHLTIASIKCDRCEKIFKRVRGLRNHMKKHLNERSDPCQLCGKTFCTDEYLKRHVLLVHRGGRSYGCPVCKARLPKPSSLRSHMVDIHQDYRYTTCKICKQPFATNSELKLHRGIAHQVTSDTRCWVCQQIFDSMEVLMAHVGDSHADSLTDRVCKICGKEFYVKYYVKKHVRSVHQPQVKDKFCTICGKRFNRRSHLKAHVATIHEGWRTDPCDVCGKRFFKYSKLREHFLAKHSERLDGRCDQCCKPFSDSEELRVHVATVHHGRHTFSCGVCQRVFSFFGYLKRHMISTHSNKFREDLYRYQLRDHNSKTVSQSRAPTAEESEGSMTTDDDAQNFEADSEASLLANQVSERASNANSEATVPMSIENQIEHE